jgi:hypothetical protein
LERLISVGGAGAGAPHLNFLQVVPVALRQARPREADGKDRSQPAVAPLYAALLVAARRVPPHGHGLPCNKMRSARPANRRVSCRWRVVVESRHLCRFIIIAETAPEGVEF